MTKHPLRKLLTVLLALCCVGALWMAVSGMLPERSQSGLAVREQLKVASAPIDKEGSAFSCLLSGSITNSGDSTVQVQRLLVTVRNGEQEREVSLPGFAVPARTDVPVSLSWKDDVEWTQIKAVVAELDEGTEQLSNVARQGLSLNVFAVVWLAVAAAFGYAAFSSGRTLRYTEQEEAMKETMQSTSEKRAER